MDSQKCRKKKKQRLRADFLNMRGSGEYRRLLTEVLTRRAWETLGGIEK